MFQGEKNSLTFGTARGPIVKNIRLAMKQSDWLIFVSGPLTILAMDQWIASTTL